jgi:hypothetical protein
MFEIEPKDHRFRFKVEVEDGDLRVNNAICTWFGGENDPSDNGQTASGVSTLNHPHLIGCALPMDGCHSSATDGSPLPKLPWNTFVRVTNRANGRTASVPLIDLGPSKFAPSHAAIDLTEEAFRLLGGNPRDGVIHVDFVVPGGESYLHSEHLNREPRSVSLRKPLSRVLEMRSSPDGRYISALLKLSSNVSQLQEAQRIAARKLLEFDGEVYPSDRCAITLTTLLQEVGISVRDTFRAFDLGKILENDRNWETIQVGQQRDGDVGSTCGSQPHHGQDHIYLVLKALNPNEMIVADNQQPEPHFRYASGGETTSTKFFLRAPE